jgi:hypothetical protein
MRVALIIVVSWLALQVPLGVLVGKLLKLRMAAPVARRSRARGADPRSLLGAARCSSRRDHGTASKRAA